MTQRNASIFMVTRSGLQVADWRGLREFMDAIPEEELETFFALVADLRKKRAPGVAWGFAGHGSPLQHRRDP